MRTHANTHVHTHAHTHTHTHTKKVSNKESHKESINRWIQDYLVRVDPPDVEAAEQGEEQAREEGHGQCQQQADHPVHPHPAHLEQGVAPEPHLVRAAGRQRLGDHVLKRHLGGE